MPKRKSFIIDDRSDGFRIAYGPNFPEVTVTRHPTHFTVDWVENSLVISLRSGFYCFYYLVWLITQGLMHDWKPPADKGKPFPGIEIWRIKKTARIIGKRVHIEWQRLLDGVDPIVLAVHRSIFAATFRCSRIAAEPELYKHKYAVNDILNFRAAAIAAVISGRVRPGHEEFQIDAAMDAMSNWRTIFSFTNKTYSSLDKTLMNIPGGIASGVLYNLNKIFLHRPIFNRLELMLVCLYAQNVRRHFPERELTGPGESDGHNVNANKSIFIFATFAQIKEAIALVAKYTRNDLGTRRTRDIKFLVQFLLDFPDEHNGNILGLTRKSIHWHRDRQAIVWQEILDRLGFRYKDKLTSYTVARAPRD